MRVCSKKRSSRRRSELFGDYTPETMLIRVWMKTAVRKEVTSFGAFLSTLSHEFCHHLDFERFSFTDWWYTRGFYERAAALYHCARGTPLKRLYWVAAPGGRWRIDWPGAAFTRRPPPIKLGLSESVIRGLAFTMLRRVPRDHCHSTR
jgi:hypothetical protein